MQYRRLGNSGLLVSSVGLGTNNIGRLLDEDASRQVIDRAIDLGVTFIDTADTYGDGASEALIGKILGARRNEVVLATKFSSQVGTSRYARGTSRRWLMQAVEASLRRLGTDVIDLYQIHRPDPETPIEETLRALDDLVSAGKVRYIGYSNVAAWQAVDGQWTARTEHLVRPISIQNRFNLLHREVEDEALPAARAHGLGIIPYVPLESGFLTGKYRPGSIPAATRLTGTPRADEILTSANFAALERFEGFAAERGHALIDLAIGWLLGHPEVGSVIASARSGAQVEANVTAGTWVLDSTEMAAMASLT